MPVVDTGWFEHPEKHHKGKYRMFRFDGATEIWLGHRWFLIRWRR